MTRFDVVVVGAGTAGSTTAWHLARRGLRVAMVERGPLLGAGARWVNGVPPWMFDLSDIPRPTHPELRNDSGAFVLLGVSGRRHVCIEPSPVWAVDMRALVRRLQGAAVEAGAVAFERTRVVGVELLGGRPSRMAVSRGRRTETLEARLFVDASGVGGVLRERVPELARACRAPRPPHICSAAQAVHRIADPDGARRFLEAHDARPGDVVCQIGVDGGYSIGNIAIDAELHEAELLTGAIAGQHHRSGPRILADMVAAHPWIGEEVFGGAGAVPLRRPYDRFVAPGAALVGNAACHVFSAHGSGIGIGMVAARHLAGAVADADDPGDERVLWHYQAGFMRTYGGLLAAYDAFRRMSQGLTGAEVEALLESGLLTEAGYGAGLDQRLPSPEVDDLLAIGRGALRRPMLAARVAPALAKMAPLIALYGRYPERPGRRLRLWSRAVAAIFGERPDL